MQCPSVPRTTDKSRPSFGIGAAKEAVKKRWFPSLHERLGFLVHDAVKGFKETIETLLQVLSILCLGQLAKVSQIAQSDATLIRCCKGILLCALQKPQVKLGVIGTQLKKGNGF